MGIIGDLGPDPPAYIAIHDEKHAARVYSAENAARRQRLALVLVVVRRGRPDPIPSPPFTPLQMPKTGARRSLEAAYGIESNQAPVARAAMGDFAEGELFAPRFLEPWVDGEERHDAARDRGTDRLLPYDPSQIFQQRAGTWPCKVPA